VVLGPACIAVVRACAVRATAPPQRVGQIRL